MKILRLRISSRRAPRTASRERVANLRRIDLGRFNGRPSTDTVKLVVRPTETPSETLDILANKVLLCTGSFACFFDDDDWRSADSVQAQLARLAATGADVCTLQVEYVCEIDAAARAARYFYLAGGGGR